MSSFLTWRRKQIHFPKHVLFFVEFRTLEKVQNPSNSEQEECVQERGVLKEERWESEEEEEESVSDKGIVTLRRNSAVVSWLDSVSHEGHTMEIPVSKWRQCVNLDGSAWRLRVLYGCHLAPPLREVLFLPYKAVCVCGPKVWIVVLETFG
jgi:hypothetical protein